MAASLIEPFTQLTEVEDGTKKTRALQTGDRVTTPDGERTGMVRNLYIGGLTGTHDGVTTVKFMHGTVRTTSTSGGRPSSYVLDVPDDADWTLWRLSA